VAYFRGNIVLRKMLYTGCPVAKIDIQDFLEYPCPAWWQQKTQQLVGGKEILTG